MILHEEVKGGFMRQVLQSAAMEAEKIAKKVTFPAVRVVEIRALKAIISV